MLKKLKKGIELLKEIRSLPKREIAFRDAEEKTLANYKRTYQYFTKLHRLKLFRNKTVGVALIDLNLYKNFEDYYKSVNGKNSSAYYARKATKREYKFIEIDRNRYIEDIYAINTSTPIRQGQKMSQSYLEKVEKYEDEPNYRYFGIVNREGKLVSYCNIAFYGEFSLVVSLLGHKEYLNDGVMYLMMIELNKIIFNEYHLKGYNYIMYDTFFGATEGLKKFKQKLGYKPYKVKWIWAN